MVNTIGRLTDREEKELQQETIAALEIYNTNVKKQRCCVYFMELYTVLSYFQMFIF